MSEKSKTRPIGIKFTSGVGPLSQDRLVRVLAAIPTIKSVVATVMLIPLDVTSDLLGQFSFESSAMPLLAPSRYIREGDLMEMNAEALRAFHKFRAELERIRGEAIEKGVPMPGPGGEAENDHQA